jgi:hypothetical protein
MQCLLKILGAAVIVVPLVFLISTVYSLHPGYDKLIMASLALGGVTLVYFLVLRGSAFSDIISMGQPAFRPKTSLTWGRLAEEWLMQEEPTKRNISLLREGLAKGILPPEDTDRTMQ